MAPHGARYGSEPAEWGNLPTVAGSRSRASIRLSPDARRGWERCSDRHAIPLTTLLEAMGRKLDDGTLRCPEDVIAYAVQLQREGWSRRKR